ncbi:hypothetical protein GCK72_005299 [Caenorhabditis remanei]|uniref:FACT complex subunit n=1 Tax=Caenorhabditis remanei TaxID=31234 RepID=A0A6A5HE04_CAERE|nr:hypothetical protein GCK72_005299 [Caenorhabditis remanei]KAF1765347.1 hypothetical protein GCK72_005299 [Caenorhabditis remanei]
MDILNSNVKYAFIQSCEQEINILLNFRLKSSFVLNEHGPVLIVPLAEVEFIRFEQSLEGRRYKYFDMVAVYKDYRIEPTSIYAMSDTYMEKTKFWFESRDICYSEGDLQINWPLVLKTVMQDAEGFFNDDGWLKFFETLNPDSSDKNIGESDH